MRTGISLYSAIAQLFDAGYTEQEVKTIVNRLPRPTAGYVYADALPLPKPKRV
jgi:hypothetical protein